MIRILCIVLFSFGSLLAFGNEIKVEKNISGIILDAESREPLAYATVAVYYNGTLIDGIITKEDGKFSMKVKPGDYLLKVEFLSYKTFEKQITLKDHLDLGVIALQVDLQALEAVEVNAERSKVELKLDKKVFNVGKDLLAQNGSLSQVLDNVPSVAVDLEGVVSLRGNTNVSVLINGKPSVLATNNSLDQISAQNIERIEVITNPSSRYQAAGTAGIINVILKKNKLEGFSGSVSLSSGSPADYNFNTHLNYKTKKFNFFSTFGYRFVDNIITQDVNQSSIVNGHTVILDQVAEEKRNAKIKSLFIGADYFINDQNTITASFYKTLRRFKNNTSYHYDYFDDQTMLDSTLVRYENYLEPQDHNQLELSYVKTFDKEGQKLTLDFQYDFWDDDEMENLTTHQVGITESDPLFSRTRDIESSKDYLVQLDFIRPFNKNAIFETGLRGETRIITSDYKVEEFDGANWEIYKDIANVLDYKEEIGGAYVQVSNKVNKFSYQLGLRAEITKISISDKKNVFKDSKKYTNLFPTAHLTYSFTESTNMQLSYSKRINRPGFWYLNPFGGLAELNTQRQGNPDMDPAFTNVFELGFLTQWGELSINPSIYFHHTTAYFEFYTDRDADGVLITKPINLDHENRIGFELSTTYTPYKWLRLSGELNYYSYQQRGDFNDQNFDFDDSSWFTRISSRVKLPSNFTLQASYNFRGENESAQTIIKSRYFMDLGMSKNLLRNNATLTLNVRNLLNSREEYLTRTGENFNYQSHRKIKGPRYSLTFNYRFNQKSNTKNRRPGASNR
ncbi:TonB-dependent receptor domain-containing protein [Xanthovirga aplysinae]|uniref:TonB-dependent receptor domain-containing protein n=1 Tax=Xanthovirga aplysinae TaxID=2529853 RepID=UPI001656B84C|nr:TonB-dependent receptor [Xanthovirga aplysinae]